MKTITRITVLITLILIFATSISAYDNSRRGMGIMTEEQVSIEIIDLAKCYSELDIKSNGVTFENYYSEFKQNGIAPECSAKLLTLGDKKVWYKDIADNMQDTDQDLFTDAEEKAAHTGLNDLNDFPWWIDIDGDGFTNDYELFKESDPLDSSNTPLGKDSDNDGFGDAYELEKNSDPLNAESVPQFTLSVAADQGATPKMPAEKSNWQIYLAIILGAALLLSGIGFIIYRYKTKEE